MCTIELRVISLLNPSFHVSSLSVAMTHPHAPVISL